MTGRLLKSGDYVILGRSYRDSMKIGRVVSDVDNTRIRYIDCVYRDKANDYTVVDVREGRQYERIVTITKEQAQAIVTNQELWVPHEFDLIPGGKI